MNKAANGKQIILSASVSFVWALCRHYALSELDFLDNISKFYKKSKCFKYKKQVFDMF